MKQVVRHVNCGIRICNIIVGGGNNILNRRLAVPLHRAALLGEPVLVQGPRGAGKTALLRREFPGHTYVPLDEAADRMRARSDPRSFLAKLRGPAVIDDLQRAPELLPHLSAPRPLILASSRRLQLPVTTFELYPPTNAEREGRSPVSLDMLGRFAPATRRATGPFNTSHVPNRSWIDRDVRDMIQVRDLDRFELFLRTAESASGAVLDMQAIGKQCGVSHRTVTRWFEVLSACFKILRLPASSLDFGRRLFRGPKLHFFDSDCFESRAVLEIYSNTRHAGEDPNLSYWRDSNGFEIQLIVEANGMPPMPISIATNPNPLDMARLHRWMALARVEQGAIITHRTGQLPRKGIASYSIAQL